MGTKNKRHRTIFIGDVHGCLDELKKMVRTLKPQPEDRIILLGDLINRGPDSAGVIGYVYESKFECILGNHENNYLMNNQTIDLYGDLRREIGEERHRWIEGLPLLIESDLFMAVHAGLEPGVHPHHSRREILLNIRTWDGSGHDLRRPENPPWYKFYAGTKRVFYGHWAKEGLTVRKNTVGLDSGCVYGNELSAYIHETGKLVQIKAARIYARPGKAMGS
jgi:hypothetical protein